MERYDDHKIYCKRLGHHLQFQYCRKMADNTPCSAIADCWYEFIPIVEYIEAHFDDWQKAIVKSAPPPRMNTLIDLINQARQRNASKNNEQT